MHVFELGAKVDTTDHVATVGDRMLHVRVTT
jgi:hypothetical protein